MAYPRALDVLTAELSFREETIVSSAQQLQIVQLVGATLGPRVIVVNLQEGLLTASVAVFGNVAAAEAIALD